MTPRGRFKFFRELWISSNGISSDNEVLIIPLCILVFKKYTSSTIEEDSQRLANVFQTPHRNRSDNKSSTTKQVNEKSCFPKHYKNSRRTSRQNQHLLFPIPAKTFSQRTEKTDLPNQASPRADKPAPRNIRIRLSQPRVPRRRTPSPQTSITNNTPIKPLYSAHPCSVPLRDVG